MTDFLNAARNVLSGRAPGDSPLSEVDNRLERVDQCKVLWYQWANELKASNGAFGDSPIPIPIPNNLLSASNGYDISNHLESVTYSKDMNGSGTFQISLQNSYDWARHMRPGQWLCIFLNGDGKLPLPAEGPNARPSSLASSLIPASLQTLFNAIFGRAQELSDLPKPPSPAQIGAWKPYLRCMGIIQRVGIKSATNTDGVVEISFVLTGKDHGVVFEESELWFNGHNADGQVFSKKLQEITTTFSRNLTELLSKWYDLFMTPATLLGDAVTNLNSFFPTQWVLPESMVSDLGLQFNTSSGSTFGDLQNVKEFHTTLFENPDPNPFAGLQGHCWGKLKELSGPEFHELFSEISDLGNPKLIFRPIPWSIDKAKYPTFGSVMLKYKDLSSIDHVNAPLPIGTNASSFSSLGQITQAVGARSADRIQSDANFSPDSRTFHRVTISEQEVESFDIGPDWHSRANFFLVDSCRAVLDQENAFSLLQANTTSPFPLRDQADIKRHGFRPKFLSVNTFTLTNGQLFGNQAQITSILEMNYIIKDFWSNAEDMYSGTMQLAGGRNDVRLGKVIVTSPGWRSGIGDFIFYIEGYVDTFSVNGENGVGTWTQSLALTRGVQSRVLDGGSTKDLPVTEPATFHVIQGGPTEDTSIVGRIRGILR